MKHTFPLIISACLFLAGCSPKYYVPSTQNVPLLSEKGELDLNLNGNHQHVAFQGAYAATKGLGLQLNGALVLPQDEENGNGGSGSFVEIGAGYYRPILAHWVFETYGIFGAGGMNNHFPHTSDTYQGTDGRISATLYRYGIQPNFGYRSKHFFAGISSRLMAVTYTDIKGSLVFDGVDQGDYLHDNNTIFLFEPALTLKVGIEWLKLQVQVGYSLNAVEYDFPQDHLNASIGLNFHLQTKKRDIDVK